jgi:AraC-like DNA-binding protein
MRVAAIRPIERFLRRLGAPTERVLESVHLPPDLMHHPETLIPAYAGTRFISESARAEGIEDLGAIVAHETRVDDLGTFGQRLVQSLTLYDLIATAKRIQSAHHSGEVYWLGRVEGRQAFCQRFTLRLDDWGLQSSQYAILLALGLFLAVAGHGWRPRVYLRKGVPRALAASEWAERADFVFDQPVSAVEMPPSVLHLAIAADETPRPNSHALTAWAESRPGIDLQTSLRQWMSGVLRSDTVRIDVLSETIGITPRTLQRRLAEVGTSYAHVLGEARFEAASRLLARADLAIRDVAHEVGYRDAAHLTRAFHRWTGTTPSEFRRLLIAEPVASYGANWQAAH